MSLAIAPVTTPEERERLFRFRYRVYVEELAMTTAADHERRWLHDELDAVSESWAVLEDGEIRGSLRVTFLEDLDDPAPLVEKYDIQPALEQFGAGGICTTSRFILDPSLRHGKVIYRLMQAAFESACRREIRLNFGDCSPHLIPFYEHLGYRRFTTGFNDTAYGFKVPILMLVRDHENFERVRSPLRRAAREMADDPEAREWFATTYAPYLGLQTASFMADDVFFDLLTERVASDPLHSVSLLQGLDRTQAETFLREATLLDLKPGDLVIREGDRDDTLFVLLAGLAEASLRGREGPPLYSFGAGDSFGEIGFLTAVPRTADVTARTECRVLVISGGFMERFIEREPAIGARVLLNLSRELAGRLALSSEQARSSR